MNETIKQIVDSVRTVHDDQTRFAIIVEALATKVLLVQNLNQCDYSIYILLIAAVPFISRFFTN